MIVKQTGLILRSFVWSFGATPADYKKGLDNGAVGTYPTPIDLLAGDNIIWINANVLQTISSVTGNAAMQLKDAAGSPLNNNGPVMGGSLPAPPPFNFPQQAGTTQNTVINSGFMQLTIAVEAYTGGTVRFDLCILRAY